MVRAIQFLADQSIEVPKSSSALAATIVPLPPNPAEFTLELQPNGDLCWASAVAGTMRYMNRGAASLHEQCGLVHALDQGCDGNNCRMGLCGSLSPVERAIVHVVGEDGFDEFFTQGAVLPTVHSARLQGAVRNGQPVICETLTHAMVIYAFYEGQEKFLIKDPLEPNSSSEALGFDAFKAICPRYYIVRLP